MMRKVMHLELVKRPIKVYKWKLIAKKKIANTYEKIISSQDCHKPLQNENKAFQPGTRQTASTKIRHRQSM